MKNPNTKKEIRDFLTVVSFLLASFLLYHLPNMSEELWRKE